MTLKNLHVNIDGSANGLKTEVRSTRSELSRLSAGAEAAGENMTRSFSRAQPPLRRLGREMTRVSRGSGAFTRGVQNAAFQVGDFAVQVGAGTDATRALAQQLPQLLQGFGVLGAVLGATVAIAIPLRTAMQGLAQSGQDVTRVFGTLEPAARAISDAFGRVASLAATMGEALVNNLDRIIVIAGTAAALFAGKFVAGFVAARVATFSLSAALVTLRGALIRTGIGALIVGAGELVFQFTRLTSAAGGFGSAMGLLGDIGLEVLGRLRQGFSLFGELVGGVALTIQGTFQSAFAAIAIAFRDMLNTVIGGINGLTGAIASSGLGELMGISGSNIQPLTFGDGLRNRGQYNVDAGNAITGSASGSMGALTSPLESVQKIRDVLASMKEDRITLPDILGVATGEGAEVGGGGQSAADKMEEQEERISASLQRLRDLTKGSLGDQLGSWGNYFQNLASLTQSGNDKVFKIAKAFSSASALVNAWTAYTEVLKDPSFVGRPWERVAAAGQVLAAGLGAVNSIKGVSAGGGGGSSGGGSGGGGFGGGAANPQNTYYNVSLPGEGPISRSGVRDLIDMINKETRRGKRLGGITYS